ncbi:MAG TPA: MFS transporter, partial [Stellaceae bacterium]|nr:MFS transporter [Stellaceae bacterium]
MAAIERETANPVPWWKEPTKDQWYAYIAAWAGWTLDAFDFTAFLLIIVPIAKEFDVPVPEVAFVLTITLWMRLVGATANGWLADRIGRKTPLMISIAWYSVCNFIAGLAPSFFILFLFRALLGIGMGAEWPAGAALAMETWPVRSRGFMGAVMQGSWGIGFLLSSALYGLFYNYIGWRGLLMIGIAPALLIIYIRLFVKEPEIWVENRRQQTEQGREVRAPLFSIFKLDMLGNTLTTCLMMASAFVIYYANYALFATHLQLDLKLSPALVALPIALANTCFFLSSLFWGWLAERIGRRWAIMIPAALGVPTAFLYLLTQDYALIVVGFALQGMFACGGMHVQYP